MQDLCKILEGLERAWQDIQDVERWDNTRTKRIKLLPFYMKKRNEYIDPYETYSHINLAHMFLLMFILCN